ncbi:carboxypeptidase regulatory-like domain-containing protein [bacterium]|nr:carboxypeptidase regulatory-like domain-containing protein [bacterium]
MSPTCFRAAFMAALICLLAGCTTGLVRGTVVDQWGKPVENANIQTLPPTHSILSTKDGFVLENVEDGEYSLIASKEGYKTGSARVEVRGKKVTYANIVLQKFE